MNKVPVQFPTRIKYRGEFYPAYTTFYIHKEDLEKFLKVGGFKVQENKPSYFDVPEPTQIEESVDYENLSKAELKELVKEQGITVKGNPSKETLINKLTK